ncbi:hypothetical protein L1887_23689 [Cichorium endivia]|nr:hypothetical protein L1887_23689 [Cichorium endivia]
MIARSMGKGRALAKDCSVELRRLSLGLMNCSSNQSTRSRLIELLRSTLTETIELAETCSNKKYDGKLQMQSGLDSLSGKLDLNLRVCRLFIKTGVLGEITMASDLEGTSHRSTDNNKSRKLLARLQPPPTPPKKLLVHGFLMNLQTQNQESESIIAHGKRLQSGINTDSCLVARTVIIFSFWP